MTTDADGGGGDHLEQEQVEEDQQQLQLQQCDDIQSDESGINMSFNNPLFANDKDVMHLFIIIIDLHSTKLMLYCVCHHSMIMQTTSTFSTTGS